VGDYREALRDRVFVDQPEIPVFVHLHDVCPQRARAQVLAEVFQEAVQEGLKAIAEEIVIAPGRGRARDPDLLHILRGRVPRQGHDHPMVAEVKEDVMTIPLLPGVEDTRAGLAEVEVVLAEGGEGARATAATALGARVHREAPRRAEVEATGEAVAGVRAGLEVELEAGGGRL